MSEGGTTDDESPLGRSFDRKRKALDDLLRFIREEGEDTPYERNNVISENETAWELGVFSDEAMARPLLERDAPLSEQVRDGMLVRARRDAMSAKLNALESGKALIRIEEKLNSLRSYVVVIAAALMAIAIKLFFL